MRIGNIRHQRGFTLIEVLISIVILSIGLLGIAGMQATSMQNNHLAFVKTQAAVMAADMADRIRANSEAAADYVSTTSDAPDDPGCIRSAAGCTPAQLAQYDLYEWNQQFTRDKPALPGGRAIITRTVDADVTTMAVTLFWQENNPNDIERAQCLPNDNNAQAENEACFQLSFRL